MKKYPSQEEIKILLDYDDVTGLFFWKERSIDMFSSKRIFKSWNTKHANKKSGSLTERDGKTYVDIRLFNSHFYAHRLAWIYVNGSIDNSMEIDHINGNGSDNRISNLRLVTAQENHKNTRKSERNTSGVVGVSWNSKRSKWVSEIKSNGKRFFLGYYSDFEEAVSARVRSQKDLMFHENHGKARPL